MKAYSIAFWSGVSLIGVAFALTIFQGVYDAKNREAHLESPEVKNFPTPAGSESE